MQDPQFKVMHFKKTCSFGVTMVVSYMYVTCINELAGAAIDCV